MTELLPLNALVVEPLKPGQKFKASEAEKLPDEVINSASGGAAALGCVHFLSRNESR